MGNTGALLRECSDDYLNGSPVQPGGSLTSKPTWPDTFGFSATSAFFCAVGGARPWLLYADVCVWSRFNQRERKTMDTQLIILIVVLFLLFGGGGGYYWTRRGRA